MARYGAGHVIDALLPAGFARTTSAFAYQLVILGNRRNLVLADATPGGSRELSRVKVFDGGKNWTSPVVCGGLVYLRNSLGELVCRDHR